MPSYVASCITILLQGEVLLRYLQTKEEQLKVLHACHVDPTACHLGKTRTIYRIKERFMLVKDVMNMVSVQIMSTYLGLNLPITYYYRSPRDVCQRMNRKMTTGAPQLHPISVKAPWHMIGIDFVGHYLQQQMMVFGISSQLATTSQNGWRRYLHQTSPLLKWHHPFLRWAYF